MPRYSLRTLLILLALAPILLFGIASQYTRKKESRAQSQLSALNSAVMVFQLDVGQLPFSLKDLDTLPSYLADPKSWRGPYLQHSHRLLDPWGNPFGYKILDHKNLDTAQDQFQIWSHGPDGRPGTADDIISRH